MFKKLDDIHNLSTVQLHLLALDTQRLFNIGIDGESKEAIPYYISWIRSDTLFINLLLVSINRYCKIGALSLFFIAVTLVYRLFR